MDKKIMALGTVILIIWLTKKPPAKPIREFSYTLLLAPPEADEELPEFTMGGGSGGVL